MTQQRTLLLKEYASNYDVNDLSSEDIIKLITKPYLINEIAEAFGITEKELNDIKKKKGIKNVNLENIIRNIEVVLHYLDSKQLYFSDIIRKQIVESLIQAFIIVLPNKEFYKKKLYEIDFSRGKVIRDLYEKNIDIDYRLSNLSENIKTVEKLMESLIEQEKNYLLYNAEKMYNQLCFEKENGKEFNKKDLTEDILYELAIIEGIPDSLIGSIFNMNKNEIRYLRRKVGLSNKHKTKLENYPQMIKYYIEENNQRPLNMTNYRYDKIIDKIILDSNDDKDLDVKQSYDIPINIDNEEIIYHVSFSDEDYTPKEKTNSRKYNGVRRNQKNENETKRLHGKIGEQIVFKAEKQRLMGIGLENLIGEVELVAQIDDDITLDGLGYDLLSFNEHGEKVCIEVKTSYSKEDKPFFISKKELDIISGIKKEHGCKHCLIYYVRIDGTNVTIKNITPFDLEKIKREPYLYKIG